VTTVWRLSSFWQWRRLKTTSI